jgi:hypothetical protein
LLLLLLLWLLVCILLVQLGLLLHRLLGGGQTRLL